MSMLTRTSTFLGAFRRCASTSAAPAQRARILAVDKGVSLAVDEPSRTLQVSGAKGNLAIAVPPFVQLAGRRAGSETALSDLNGIDALSVMLSNPKNKHQLTKGGYFRGLVKNAITGVNEGFTYTIQIVGIGYRVLIDELPGQKNLQFPTVIPLRLGHTHKVYAPIPQGLTVDVNTQTELKVFGADKKQVGDFCSMIRKFRPPEPYNGKGVFVQGESIKMRPKRRGK